LLSALLTRPYERSGPRYAPLIGAVAGTLWVVAMFFRIRWFGYPDEFEMAQWTLGTDISVHAAGFAGAALMTALLTRYDFSKALGGGLLLAAAMTTVPYASSPGSIIASPGPSSSCCSSLQMSRRMKAQFVGRAPSRPA
jgi:hypothetical protein